MMQVSDDPDGISITEVENQLKELQIGFQKLDAAQSRSECLFASAIDLAALLCHAHGARTASRAIHLKTWYELRRDDIDAALDSLQMALRLSRDLRPRGASISQLVSIACDGMAFQQIIPEILAHDELTIEQCDRLLDLLKEHAVGRDPLLEAFKADYVMTRVMLHNAEHATGIFDRKQLREAFGTDGDPVDVIVDLSMMSSKDRMMRKLQIKAEINSMTSADYRKRVVTLNQYYAAVVRVANNLARSTEEDFARLNRILEEQSLFLKISLGEAVALSRAARRHMTLLRGTACLVALRRWSIQTDSQPKDLESVVRAAGLPSVPVDPYGGERFRMARPSGVPVIYSVGHNRHDDGAEKEWKGNPAEPAGDMLFRVTWE